MPRPRKNTLTNFSPGHYLLPSINFCWRDEPIEVFLCNTSRFLSFGSKDLSGQKSNFDNDVQLDNLL